MLIIGENETTQKASVEKTHKRLIETELKGLEVDLLHGRLTGPEKYEVMTNVTKIGSQKYESISGTRECFLLFHYSRVSKIYHGSTSHFKI